jgi:predicted nucleic acid-binding protein
VDSSLIVVDTNLLFGSLLHPRASLREIILMDITRNFFSPRYAVVELFKHKERIMRYTRLGEEELLECFNALLSHITFVDEGLVPIGTWIEGLRLCDDVDRKDAPFVTLTLHIDGLLWTQDTELKSGLVRKGFDRFFSP